MHQKRLMGGSFALVVLILSLHFFWLGTIENDDYVLFSYHTTNGHNDIFQIQLNITFGGLEADSAVKAIQTADGGIFIAGSTGPYGTDERDMWLIKTYANGSAEWNQTYDIWGTDWASDLIQTEDGGFLLIGTSSLQYMLPVLDRGSALKLFANGTVEWCQSYYFERTEWVTDENSLLRSAIQTAEGGFLLAGETVDYSGPNNMDMWMVKTDANGSVEWNQIYGSKDDSGYSIIQTIDGGFLIAGKTIDYHYSVDSAVYPHDADMWLVKIYANGSVVWDQAYGGTGCDYAFDVIQTVDDGFLLAGVTNYWSNNSDMWLVKTYANGSVEWDQTYGGLGHDQAHSVIQTPDGGFLIVGDTESYGAGDEDIWLVKTYSNGTIKWNQTFGGSDIDRAYSLIPTLDGSFIIVGMTRSYGAGNGDIWLLKISEVIDSPTDSITSTIIEDVSSSMNTLSTNTSKETKNKNESNPPNLIPGFESPSIIVFFLLLVIILKRRKSFSQKY